MDKRKCCRACGMEAMRKLPQGMRKSLERSFAEVSRPWSLGKCCACLKEGQAVAPARTFGIGARNDRKRK